MKALERRLNALEARGAEMPANLRRWLGYPLSEAERAEADRLDALPVDAVDLSGCSAEMTAWLTLESGAK